MQRFYKQLKIKSLTERERMQYFVASERKILDELEKMYAPEQTEEQKKKQAEEQEVKDFAELMKDIREIREETTKDMSKQDK